MFEPAQAVRARRLPGARAAAEHRFERFDPAELSAISSATSSSRASRLITVRIARAIASETLGQRLLLVLAGDRPVGTRADEQIADRLLLVRARHERHPDREDAVRRLRRCRSCRSCVEATSPVLDLFAVDVRGPAARSRRRSSALRTARTPRSIRARISSSISPQRRGFAHVAHDFAAGRCEAGTGSSGTASRTSAGPVPGSG